MEDGSGHHRPRGRVIVVGSINLDLVLRVPRLPLAGETVTGGTLERHHGGKGANQAVAAARSGADGHLVGAVGEDDGQESLDALAAEGVEISTVARLHGQHTGHAVVIVDKGSGENQIAVAPGANAAVTAGHVRRSFGALRIAQRDVIVLSFELMDPPLLAAAAAARRAGATLVVNPAPARECDPGLLRGAVLTPNWRELMALSAGRAGSGRMALREDTPGNDGAQSDDAQSPAESVAAADQQGTEHGGTGVAAAASALSGRTGGAVVATLGKRGALLADGTTVEYFPGHLVTAHDTTGAGDTLTGVLAAGLAEGRDRRMALRRAVAAAALAVTRPGARDGMPAAGEIDALLDTGR
jgi:ribokinase